MYRLELADKNIWAILDDSEEDVFRGTLSECERWLDAAENCRPQQACSEFRLRDWILLALTHRPIGDWRLPLGSRTATGRFDE